MSATMSATALGEPVGPVVGSVVGVDVGTVADGEVGTLVTGSLGVVLPLQATPFRVKAAGDGLLPVQVPLKPNEALPLVASAPFQLAPTALTVSPEDVTVAFQAWETRCPAGKVQPTVQLVTGSPRFFTATLAVKPLGHWLPTV
jgi:hypothetical protein